MIDSLHKYPVFPDLLDNQKRSLQYFWKKGILEELELFSYLSRSNTEDFNENSQNDLQSERKNQTSFFSFFSRGVNSLHSKSVFQFHKKNDTQKRRITPTVFFDEASFHQFKEAPLPFSFSKKIGEQQNFLSHSSSIKSRFQNLRPLKFSFRSSVLKEFHDFSSIQNHKDTQFKPESFHYTDDSDSGKNSKIIIHGSKFLLKKPQYSKQQAIRGQKTYSVGLYIPVEFVENMGSPKKASMQGGDFFLNQGEKQSLFQTKFEIPTQNSENSKLFAFSNVYNPSDCFSFLGTSSSLFSSPEKNKNNPRHVVGGLGFTSFTNHNLVSEVFGQTSSKKDQLEQEVKPRWFYFGDIPLMTERGSFLINGAPRVLVNQIIRCPSVYFKLKLDSKNRRSFIASFLSEYGSWLRLETDRLRSRIWVRIDKSPRFPLDWLLSALGWSSNQTHFQNSPGIAEDFETNSFARIGSKNFVFKTNSFPVQKKNGILGSSAKTISKFVGLEGIPAKLERLESLAKPTIQASLSDRVKISKNSKNGNSSLIGVGERFGKTQSTHQEATQLIWKKCNPSRWTSFIGCYSFFYTKFFHPRRYSLGNLGRVSLNKRLGRRGDCEIPTLTPEDIFLALDYLIQLQNGNESGKFYLDDIDHLKNRRVRLPGEIIQNQFRLALSRLSGVVFNSLNSRTKTQGSWGSATSMNSYESRIRRESPIGDDALSPSILDSNQSQTIQPQFPLRVLDTNQDWLPISGNQKMKDGEKTQPKELVNSETQFGLGSNSNFSNLSLEKEIGSVSKPESPDFVGVSASSERLDSGISSLSQGLEGIPAELERLDAKAKLLHQSSLPKIDSKASLSNQGSTIAQIFGGSPPQSFVSTLRELFNTSQLSQYMDQTNPLAEITHKRRLTSLGPGGVGRDQAGFAVREIHPSHFGRICPIETPEGQNAGLVGSLASYARINADGFLQSPAMSLFSSNSPFPGAEKDTNFLSKASEKKPIYLFSAEAEDEIYLCTADIGAVTARSRMNQVFSAPPEKLGKKSIPFRFQSDEPVPIRFKQEFIATSGKKIQYTGICPIQMISVATSLIPFLEHDDANRALMGSNMQRQAVPLVFPEKAFVGTGLEMQAARDSSTPLISSVSGQVHFVDATRIEIRHESNQSKSFDLLTYARSNQSTSIHHRPAVQLNEWVEKGDILADGSATHDGELSLGKNLLLAYMPWEGYNFEDAIVINERLVYEDVYTSLHVERYEVDIRNAQPLRLGLEFQAKSIVESNTETELNPSVGILNDFHSFHTKDHPEGGFNRELGEELPGISAKLASGADILPPNQNTSKQDLTMLEIGKEYITRDLDLVFGGRPVSRSFDVSDDQVSDLSQAEISGESELLGQSGKLDSGTKSGNQDRFLSETRNFSSQIYNLDSEGIIQPGTWVKEGDILVGKITPTQRTKISAGQSPPEYRLLVAIFADGASKIESSFNIRLKNTSFKAGIGVKGRVIDCIIPWRPSSSISRSDSLNLARSPNRQTRKAAPIQIFLAHKKRIQLGDKMSGRHGNKGIVSLILPPHDMPYTQDGKPIDVVLNPLGVPSRMNVGQVLESLLGLVSAANHQIYRLMPFDEMYGEKSGSDSKITRMNTHIGRSANLEEELVSETRKNIESISRPETSRSIVYSKLQTTRNLLGKAAEWYFDPNNPGKTQIFDGRTGEVFHQPALVGYSYMFKLIHLVDDKIHARSTGPYSLVTQQPLGGRSKKGGQRLGEMEVWALEGFGAAYILQEFLTVKSDEIYSRNTFLLDLMKRKTEESKTSMIYHMTSRSSLEENANFSSNTGEIQEKTESLLQSLEKKLGIFKSSDTLENQSDLTFDSRNLGSKASLSHQVFSAPPEFLPESSRGGKKLRSTNESRVPESFRVLVNELQALCLSVYYNPDFRLSYPSLLGWDGVFLLASKKFPTSPELSQIKNIGF